MRFVVGLVVVAACGSSGQQSQDAPGMVSDAAHDGVLDAALDGPSTPGMTYVKASNTGSGDSFGIAVALSGDGQTLAVAAPNQANISGAVYVYVHAQGTWTQQALVKGSNTEAPDSFGSSLALSDDGNTLAVGAVKEQSCATGVDGNQQDNACSTSGAVYVFSRAQGAWTQQSYLKASNTPYRDGYVRDFGQSLALSGDGTTLAVGDPGESSNATGIDGDQTNTSIVLSGAVFVFVRSGATWTQQAYVKAAHPGAQDELGASVALSRTGDVLVAGAPGEASAATGVNGSQIDDSKSESGAAYVYRRSGTTWTQEAYAKASNTDHNDDFGWAVTIAADGVTFAVGAYGEASNATGVGGDQTDNSQLDAGAVYVFANDGAQWAQQAYLKEPVASRNADFFGYSLGLSADGNTLAAGAWNSQIMPGHQVGQVYELRRAGTTWAHAAMFAAPHPDMSDLYGYSVAIAGDGSVLAIGAPGEDSAATGINGNDTDNSMSGAGAAWVIE